jgi:probable HAF family extracellular repeat protein
VTGCATTEVGVRRAFLYSDGKMNPIKGDGNTSAGWAINAGDEVAGDAILERREQVYREARSSNPRRWTQQTRNQKLQDEV